MANITRSAKSGNDWTENELAAYNICVVEQSLVNFFGIDKLPSVLASFDAFITT
jgi:NADH dehydrogenase (ubiquinone) flavoprotein 1